MKSLLVFLLLSSLAGFAQIAPDTAQKMVTGRTNDPAQLHKPYLIVILADGFGYDLAKKHHAGELLKRSEQGVSADFMKPAFPSLTLANLYCIATGLYPAHNGIVDNIFYDPGKQEKYEIGEKMVNDSSWYGGTPIWVLAEQQHLLSACFYWAGSEAAIKGVRPAYYYNYNTAIPISARIRAVGDWLSLPEQKRPHLILFYLPQADHAEHRFGPDAPETAAAVQLVDSTVAALTKVADSVQLPVNFIFLSDHGMAQVDTAKTPLLNLGDLIDLSKFIIPPESNIIMHLYAKDRNAIAPAYRALKAKAADYEVYLTGQTPGKWHYSTVDDEYGRLGDILLVAKPGKGLPFAKHNLPAANRGAHGYDNDEATMRATFYAWGPAFRTHLKIGSFANVDVYPLMAKILGLNPDGKTDGSLQIVKNMLK